MKSNNYAGALVLFPLVPKAVYAAIAYAFIVRTLGGAPGPIEVEETLMREWTTLHENGIVPQKPPKQVTK